MKYPILNKLVEIAQGNRKAELVLKNANVINVFSEEIIKADIAISGGMIVGVGEYTGETETDMTGKYISPGFIDAHLHLESSLVTPAELIYNAVQWGTTTYIADPHESANVSGTKGIDYILDETKDVMANVYLMIPSCVPATRLEDNGYTLKSEDMKKYISNPRILGLGEVMDYCAVLSAEDEIIKKLELFSHKVLDGHAPFLSDKQLAAYTLAGISTDHECCDFEYAMKELRNGMQILIREGSAAKNVEAIVMGIVDNRIDTSGFSFCTDDKHIEDIRKEGHISFNIKKAVSLGLDPVKAIKMATINTAKCYGLKHLGAIAPGYQADLVVLNNLSLIDIDTVYYKGLPIEQKTPITVYQCPNELKNTIHIDGISTEMFKLKASQKPMSVIKLVEGQIITEHIKEMLPSENNIFIPSGEYNKVAVIERHKSTKKIGVAVVSGFGITGGAIASSVSHDSHNVIVIGDNDHDMLLAVKELIRTQGGYSLVENGKVLMTLPLPIMGLMSDSGFEEVNKVLHDMIYHAHRMGVTKNIDPFITLSFVALPVIPEIRITTRGLYDVVNGVYCNTL